MANTKDMNENQKESEKSKPAKVILAEDDKDDQEMFLDAIAEAKILADLTIVNNGKELLDTLKSPEKPKPDIIFLDLNMPLVNGKQALSEIKKNDTLKEIPTVILSTSDSKRDIDDTFNEGANLYVRKPFFFESLVLLLKKIFTLKWAGYLINPLKKTFYMSEKDIFGGTSNNSK